MNITKKMLQCRFCGGEMTARVEGAGRNPVKIFSCPKETCEKKKNK